MRKMDLLVPLLVLAILVLGAGSVVLVVGISNARMSTSNSNPFFSGAPGYPKWSAFTNIQWDGEQPLVEFEGQWYTLVRFHGIHVDDIQQACEDNGWRYRHRFTEDLVQIVRLMGHAIDRTTTLELRDADGNSVIMEDVVMTESNQRVLVQAQRNGGAETAVVPQLEPKSWRPQIDESASRYTVRLSANTDVPAEPLIAWRWANEARGVREGATILWLHEGRPVVASAVYPWRGQLATDFTALTGSGPVVREGAEVAFAELASEVTFHSVMNIPAPASTREERDRQMAELSKRFSSTLVGWKQDLSDRAELQAERIYRYPEDTSGAIDGCVIAFVLPAGDPESLLLIEATATQPPTWRYGFARRTSGHLEGRYEGALVWSADRQAVPHLNRPRP